MIDLGSLSAKYADLQPADPGGLVYRAVHRELGRPVTIKLLPRLSLAGSGAHGSLFHRGAKAAAGLQHPSIVQVLDYETTLAGNVLVQEYVEGETLDAVLQREGRLPPERAFAVAAELAEALAAAHAAGRIHRNLKPTEIVMTPAGHVKLGGFEAALLPADVADEWPGASRLGNALYVSPEQVQGQPLTERADVYALGVLVYLMLTGQPPVGGTVSHAVLYQKVKKDPPPPSRLCGGLSAELDAVVLKMLHRAPEQRFPSMAEVRQALAPLFAPPQKAAGDLHETVALRYPFPIAMPYALVWHDLEAISRFHRLLDVFEATLKYCAGVALLATVKNAAEHFSGVLGTLRRPSLGHWVDYLGTAVRAAPSPPPLVARLRDVYLGDRRARRRCHDIVEAGVALRNRFRGHGATHREEEYQKSFDELLPAVHELLGALDFLADFPLARVEGLKYTRGQFTVTYRSCMGAVPAFRMAETQLGQPVEHGRLGILDPSVGTFTDLAPLLSYRVCPICGDEEIFYYNGMQGDRRCSFLSYQKGHGFDEETAGDPFAECGIVWRN
jgi:hypothetical protein